MSGGGAGKKRPADEPAKDWQKTLEHVRKLAAVMRQVNPRSCTCILFGNLRHSLRFCFPSKCDRVPLASEKHMTSAGRCSQAGKSYHELLPVPAGEVACCCTC